MESAAITLVQGDLRGVVRARRLSAATMRNIRQNLFFAFIYNSLGVPIAAGILYPFSGLLLSPMIASAAMTFSSVSVIANALRLRRVRLYWQLGDGAVRSASSPAAIIPELPPVPFSTHPLTKGRIRAGQKETPEILTHDPTTVCGHYLGISMKRNQGRSALRLGQGR
jgi:hypothetical protein